MKTIVTIVVLAVIVLLILFLTGGEVASVSDEMGEYFEERMITLGVEDIGQPIEGFDASLLIIAFPGLVQEDFEGVESTEGYYEVEGGTLKFVRDVNNPITSAERMVSSEGYKTLLANVAERFEMDVQSEADVDDIIVLINTDETIETSIDQGASALDVTVVPLEVLEDSRCPIDVECVQAGTVRVRTLLTSGLGEAEQIFVLNTPITTEAEEITLVRVSPQAEDQVTIEDEDYKFFFRVVKRNTTSVE